MTKRQQNLELAKHYLQVCVDPIEGIHLMDSILRIMYDASEYLLPLKPKRKMASFFMPRHMVDDVDAQRC